MSMKNSFNISGPGHFANISFCCHRVLSYNSSRHIRANQVVLTLVAIATIMVTRQEMSLFGMINWIRKDKSFRVRSNCKPKK